MKALLFFIATTSAVFVTLAGLGHDPIPGQHLVTFQGDEAKVDHKPALPIHAPGPKTFRETIQAKVGRHIEFRPDFDLPEGHRVFGLRWRVGSLHFNQYTLEGGAPLGIGSTDKPGTYRVEFYCSHAKVKLDADGDEIMLWPPGEVIVTWNVEIDGPQLPRPPPVDPDKPEPPAPGTKSTAIIYSDQAPAPIHGQAAAMTIRKEGGTVFFTPAGTNEQPPKFLAAAWAKAQEVGLPALVIMNGQAVDRALPLPATTQAIMAEVNK